MRYLPGTVGAMRFGVVADCGDTTLAVEHLTRMADDLVPEWPTEIGYEVTFEGEPNMRLHLVIGSHGEDHAEQGCLATAMHAINAMPAVVAARTRTLRLVGPSHHLSRTGPSARRVPRNGDTTEGHLDRDRRCRRTCAARTHSQPAVRARRCMGVIGCQGGPRCRRACRTRYFDRSHRDHRSRVPCSPTSRTARCKPDFRQHVEGDGFEVTEVKLEPLCGIPVDLAHDQSPVVICVRLVALSAL